MVLASWDHNNWPSNLELKETILNHNFHRKALARRIRRREKPFLALKGYHGNFFGKNTFSYVYIHGKNFKKVEKSCFSQCPGFLQLPILAIGFSPNWVNLEPTYSVCLAHKGLNSPKSCTVGQSTTILYCWEPLGASLDQFGPLWSDLRAQSKILGPVWSQFLTCLLYKRAWKTQNYVQWDRV